LERAALVSTGALSAAARRIDLGRYLLVGRGVEASGGRQLDSLLANAVEALIGAIYMDRGLKAASKAFTAIAAEPAPSVANFKGRLQELSQADSQGVPRYEVIEASGPGHRRRYRVEVWLGGRVLGVGEGSTRRAAEQAAAAVAIGKFDAEGEPEDASRTKRPRKATRAQDVVPGGS
jgi:ribonuclease-3